MDFGRIPLQLGFFFQCLFYHGQRFMQTIHRMECRALICPVVSALAEGVAQNNAVFVRYGTGCIDGVEHLEEPYGGLKSMYQAMKQAFTSDGAAPGERVVVDLPTHLIAGKSRPCEESDEVVYNEDETGSGIVESYFRLWMTCVANIWKLRNRHLDDAIDILRLLTTELEVQERQSHRKTSRIWSKNEAVGEQGGGGWC